MHCAATAKGVAVLQLPRRTNSAAAAPPRVKALKLSGALPLFCTVTVCGADVAPSGVSAKFKACGPSAMPGRGAAVAVPVSVSACGLPAAFCVMLSMALPPPTAAGV